MVVGDYGMVFSNGFCLNLMIIKASLGSA